MLQTLSRRAWGRLLQAPFCSRMLARYFAPVFLKLLPVVRLSVSVWNILGIPPTRDAAKIRRTYVEKARKCHPEEDPEGFRRLHEAYREAMRDAREEESRDTNGEQGGRYPVLLAGGGNLRRITVGGSAGQDEGEASPTVPSEAEEATEDTLSFASANRGVGDVLPSSVSSPAAEAGENFSFPPVRGAASIPPDSPDAEQAAEKPLSFAFTGRAVSSPAPPANGEGDAPALPDAGQAAEEPLSFATTGRAAPSGTFSGTSAATGRGETPPPVGHVTPLLFPGMPSLLDGDGEGFPLMPLPLPGGGVESFSRFRAEHFPQTPEEEERKIRTEKARASCLRNMKILNRQEDARWEDWLSLFRSENFALVGRDREFLAGLLELCRASLSLPMAKALYTAYGFASSAVPCPLPMLKELRDLLRAVLRLPAADVPLLSLEENVRQCGEALDRLKRLECPVLYVWQQALQHPDIAAVKHQPYFLDLLSGLCAGTQAPEAMKIALAQWYLASGQPTSPCLLPLAEFLPADTGPHAEWPAWNPLAQDIFGGGAEAFLAALRKKALELLLLTKKGFAASTRRTPWDHVFGRPEVLIVLPDPDFMEDLCVFLEQGGLPDGIWPVVADAYAPLWNAPGAAARHLPRLRKILEKRRAAEEAARGERFFLWAFFARHPVLLTALLIYCLAAGYVTTVEPWLGGGMFLLLVFLLLF